VEAVELSKNDFNSGETDVAIRVNFVWGIAGLDKAGTSMWDPADLGRVIWDEEMDVSPEKNQQAIFDFCEGLYVSCFLG